MLAQNFNRRTNVAMEHNYYISTPIQKPLINLLLGDKTDQLLRNS